MAAESNDEDTAAAARAQVQHRRPASDDHAEQQSEEEEEGDNSDDEEAEEEPKLKYTRLTSSLGPVYRNGDATSTFMVAGDKMVRRIAPQAIPCRKARAEL
jgi:hypothetical protein